MGVRGIPDFRGAYHRCRCRHDAASRVELRDGTPVMRYRRRGRPLLFGRRGHGVVRHDDSCCNHPASRLSLRCITHSLSDFASSESIIEESWEKAAEEMPDDAIRELLQEEDDPAN